MTLTAAIQQWEGAKWSPKPVDQPTPNGYIDCLGFVLEVWRSVGAMPDGVTIPPYDFRETRFTSGVNALLALLDQYCVEVESPVDGDLVVARQFKSPSHVGIYSDGMVWHMSQKGLRPFMLMGLRTRIYRLR